MNNEEKIIRMLERKIKIEDVINVLKNFQIIEKYFIKDSLPLFLLLGETWNKKPLHVLIALNDDTIWIITCYVPDINLWENNFTKRRKNR